MNAFNKVLRQQMRLSPAIRLRNVTLKPGLGVA